MFGYVLVIRSDQYTNGWSTVIEDCLESPVVIWKQRMRMTGGIQPGWNPPQTELRDPVAPGNKQLTHGAIVSHLFYSNSESYISGDSTISPR